MNPHSLSDSAEMSFQLLLRIRHPSLDIDEVTRTLDLEPEHAANAGRSISPSGKESLHAETYWLATLPTPSLRELSAWVVEPKVIASNVVRAIPGLSSEARAALGQAASVYDLHLLWWLKKLDAKRAFFKRVNDEKGTVTVVLQRTNRNAPFVITPILAKRLVDLGADFEID
jgi:hypothetical protein